MSPIGTNYLTKYLQGLAFCQVRQKVCPLFAKYNAANGAGWKNETREL